MKRIILTLAVFIVAVCGIATPATVSAQEILLEGPLAGAPAVRKLVQFRNKRFSVGPQFAYTLLNRFQHNILIGARLEYNVFDWMGIGALASFGLNFNTQLTNHIIESRGLSGNSTIPTESNWPSYTGAANFEDQVAKLKGQLLGQISLVPFRGKLSMFEKMFVAIDGAIFVGGGAVFFDQRVNCDGTEDAESNSCGDWTSGDPNDYAPTMKTTVGGAFTWGVNFMAYFNNWIALNVEYRMTPFKWNTAGTDEAGQNASHWEYVKDPDTGRPIWELVNTGGDGNYPNKMIGDEDKVWNVNQSIGIGVIFYLPFTPSISD